MPGCDHLSGDEHMSERHVCRLSDLRRVRDMPRNPGVQRDFV